MTLVLKDRKSYIQKKEFSEERFNNYIDDIGREFPHLSTDRLKERTIKTIRLQNEITADDVVKKLELNVLDNISMEEPDWTFYASRILLKNLYKKASYNRSYDAGDKYGSYYGLLKKLGEKGVYSDLILTAYSKDEIKLAQTYIVTERDHLFDYIGLKTLESRYLAKDYNKDVYELPQERFLTIALVLMANEDKNERMELVKESYWAISNHYMTVATPTYGNAGKTSGQLSSCFIDTVGDSLQEIYDSNTDIANLSKDGGGIGVYLGKIRSKNSDIRGYKNASSGVIPWMRQINNTAVSVDQLGRRKGAIAVYLDVWHKDINAFLDSKLNNGDERQRTHDLFTGICIPDLFMEQVEKRGDWYLFDPHEVKAVMGWSLEDHYDEEYGCGSFREKYEECVKNNDLSKEVVPAIDIMKRIMKSQLETGTPYMFYRDEVNRMNPNKHAGMIYSSNVCSEINQNQSPTSVESMELVEKDGGTKIVITKTPGDFVVCNLSSIHLGRASEFEILKRLIPIQVRMLDNVIDHNTINVLQAQHTNKNYRAVGIGTFSWHHILAIKGIKWESDEAVAFADELYEKIAYLTIKASSDLAIEKGNYPLFEGSEWNSGEYFERRGYISHGELDWDGLKEQVSKYMRNAYVFAVAPNASTAILGHGTPSIDPIFKKLYFEEKKDYRIPITVPDLSPKTTWHYKSAYDIDQVWSIKQNAARTKHIDQSQSFNLYVKNTIKATDLLNLHLTAWKSKLKTTYYLRSTAVDITECESCAS